MLARINNQRRVTLIDETTGWMVENANRDRVLRILVSQGHSRAMALAITHTSVSDDEWFPAYRKAKDKKRNAIPN